jgi:hypothetical protein
MKISSQIDELEMLCAMPMFLGYLFSEHRLREQEDTPPQVLRYTAQHGYL